MNKINTETASLSEVIIAALSSFSEKQKAFTQPVAMLPGRNAMDADSFIRRNGTMPFSGSEGVLLGLSSTNSGEWDYLHLRETEDGALSVEPDEDMSGVAAVLLPKIVDVDVLSNTVVDQFIALGVFTRQQWQA